MEKFDTALPRFLREALSELSPAERESLEELHLREGFPLSAIRAGREWQSAAWRRHRLEEEELRRVLETAGQGSVHTVLDAVRSGYVTAAGGLRIGICGEGAVENGNLRSFRRITSLTIRFPHTVHGIARPLLPRLLEGGRFPNTLLLSPPGGGKTTLLRDIVRCLSQGDGLPPRRVGVADERGEIGAGSLRYSLGPRVDVMENCPKSTALLLLLRGMSPEVLAADEITASADLLAMEEAAGCGVTLLATAHGGSFAELALRPLYREMLEQHIFRRFVLISQKNGQRVYTVMNGEGKECC